MSVRDFFYICTMKLSKISQKPKQPKKNTVKKNTWYRNFRAWVLRLEHRQMNDAPSVYIRDTEQHVCKHCGTEYSGAYCPKCSMPARWHRFNWKLLFLNFMDIWGLGNRPMFRTIRDLFWRPGYMIRDYMHGHQLSYFPPFKMLAVLTIIFLFVSWLIFKTSGIEPKYYGDIFQNAMNESPNVKEFLSHLSAFSVFVIQKSVSAFAFLEKNLLYRLILLNILMVLAVKWAFRKVSDFNLVETFISQIYINCQFLLISILSLLLTWKVYPFGIFPYMGGLLPTPIVLAYDFHQLYGLSWKRALWKTIVAMIYYLLIFVLIVLIVSAILIAIEWMINPELDLYIDDMV